MKIVFALFFLAMCSTSYAERYTLLPDVEDVVSENFPGWKIGASGEPGVFLMHPASIIRDGDIVQVWELGSYFSPKTNIEGRTYQSDKSLHRYDCKNRTFQVITMTRYADSKAQGEKVDYFKNSNPETNYIAPGSIGEMMMRASCQKTIKHKSHQK